MFGTSFGNLFWLCSGYVFGHILGAIFEKLLAQLLLVFFYVFRHFFGQFWGPDFETTFRNLFWTIFWECCGTFLGILFGHFFTFFAYKWQTPRKNVHEVGQPIGMRTTVELSDVHNIVLVFKHSSLVVKKGKIRISNLLTFGMNFYVKLIGGLEDWS